MKNCERCGKTFPSRLTIEGKRRNFQHRRYCLECSPWEQHNTRKLTSFSNLGNEYIRRVAAADYTCRCGETDPEKFYGKKKHICSRCHNLYSVQHGREKRQIAITQLGGKCVVCGFNEYSCSLDIHHLDPMIKDDNFRRLRSWPVDRIYKEIANCVLLCKNCHAALHAGHDILTKDMVSGYGVAVA